MTTHDIIKGIPLERLAEICEAERDGRCVALPCKVGDVLHEPYKDGIDSGKVHHINIDIESDTGVYEPADIGETVFLTRAEAEAALKEGAI